MNTLGKMTLAGAVGMLLGYMAATQLPSSTRPRNVQDCLWEASKRPTEAGAGLAAGICRGQVPR